MASWCSQNGITPIKASPDKFGWDYLLQFPAPHGPHEPPERSCKVQVKTTTTDTVSADIKLDNWERMAKERIPWFVVHIRLVNREPHVVHLVHVGEQQAVRVLERLRQLEEGAELHKLQMSVGSQPEDALVSPFHVGLRQPVSPPSKARIADPVLAVDTRGVRTEHASQIHRPRRPEKSYGN